MKDVGFFPKGLIRRSGILELLSLVLLTLTAPAQPNRPRLEILAPRSEGWVRLNSSIAPNTLLTVEASPDLITWQAMATAHDALFAYPDAASGVFQQRFYRLFSRSRVATNDWKNQILFPEDSFQSAGDQGGQLRWVKFAILLNDPVRVIYQHSTNYPFHYDFARWRLAPFAGMDRAAFDAVSLRRTNQQVVLGAVLYSPAPIFLEYGIQFVGLDPYPPEDICRWFELVRATVHPMPRATAVYLPTFEQRASAEANRGFFEAKGIPVASLERWVEVNHCYSPGWAFGRLKFLPAAEIDEAYADGRLRPEDILLTDGVPAETPLVAGIISLTPATPNSHVAILSRSFGVPFVYLPDEAERERVRKLAGREVIVRAWAEFGRCEVKIIDAEGALDQAQKAELLALRLARPIAFPPKTSFGAISSSTDTLVPADIRYFGGKAANYGLLRRSVPSNCPPAIAFSFDLWDAFLGQMLTSGATLSAEITARLAPYTNFPPDIASLKTNLAAIRDLIIRHATFTAVQQRAITNALGVFNPVRRIRFRSSTNVEDSEHFTGAGLYDSYSGCLLDDLDDDTAGPSHCESDEEDERGVFRALRRVYASFYNDNAFLERLRHGVNESQVGMGVLVHHSFPDEEELANGVATLRFDFSPWGTSVTGDLVTQLGATPVTNPDGTAAPEVVDASQYDSFVSLVLKQHSSLVPLGAYVMPWQDDYEDFMGLFTTVAREFREIYPEKDTFHLDFEYKKDVGLGLVVKQVRQLPVPNPTNEVTPFLVNEPTSYCVAQEEFGDVVANHRLKSLWTLHTANARLHGTNLTQTIYRTGAVEYVQGTNRLTLTGPVASWPNASNSIVEAVANDFWTTGDGNDRRDWKLETSLILTVSGARSPVVTQQDFFKTVTVIYAKPVPTFDFSGGFTTTTNETVRLVPCLQDGPGAIFRQHLFTRTNVSNGRVMAVETSFYWPKPPSGPVAGYTAPLIHFVETRISGLTTIPIVLHNYYSQTYRPGHHNFSEEFIFEPRLEPDLPAGSLDELNAANIQWLHIHWRGDDIVTFTVLGLDGELREL